MWDMTPRAAGELPMRSDARDRARARDGARTTHAVRTRGCASCGHTVRRWRASHVARTWWSFLCCFRGALCVLIRLHARGGASARETRAWAHRTRRGARADARDEAREGDARAAVA